MFSRVVGEWLCVWVSKRMRLVKIKKVKWVLQSVHGLFTWKTNTFGESSDESDSSNRACFLIYKDMHKSRDIKATPKLINNFHNHMLLNSMKIISSDKLNWNTLTYLWCKIFLNKIGQIVKVRSVKSRIMQLQIILKEKKHRKVNNRLLPGINYR